MFYDGTCMLDMQYDVMMVGHVSLPLMSSRQ